MCKQIIKGMKLKFSCEMKKGHCFEGLYMTQQKIADNSVQINLTSCENRLTKKSSENFMREYNGIENSLICLPPSTKAGDCNDKTDFTEKHLGKFCQKIFHQFSRIKSQK